MAARYYVHLTGLPPEDAGSEKKARKLAKERASALARDGMATVYLRSPDGSPDVKIATYALRDGKIVVERPDSAKRSAWR